MDPQTPIHKSCDLCGGNQYQAFFTDDSIGGTLVKCQTCGMFYVNNIYNDVRQQIANSQELVETPGWAEYKREAVAKHANFVKRYQLLEPYLGPRILEIGCSAGFFLQVAQAHGHQVLGIEPDRRYARYAVEQLKVPVMSGLLEKANLPPRSFDSICMFHVLEHVPSPTRVLEQIYALLRPGGYLILEVPNIDNIWFRLLGKKWRQFFLGHYYFFGPRTLRMILEKNRYHPESVRSIGRTVSLRYLAGRVGRYSSTAARALEWFVAKARIAERTVTVNLGDVMIGIATLPDQHE